MRHQEGKPSESGSAEAWPRLSQCQVGSGTWLGTGRAALTQEDAHVVKRACFSHTFEGHDHPGERLRKEEVF